MHDEGVIFKLTHTQNGVTRNWYQGTWDDYNYDRYSFYVAIQERAEIKNSVGDPNFPVALTLF